MVKKTKVFVIVCLVIIILCRSASAEELRRVDAYITGNTWQRMNKIDKACYLSAFFNGYANVVERVYSSDYDVTISREFHAEIVDFFDTYLDVVNDNDDTKKLISVIDDLYGRDERYAEITVGRMLKMATAILGGTISDEVLTDRLKSLLDEQVQHNSESPSAVAAELVDVKTLTVKNIDKGVRFIGVGRLSAKYPAEIRSIYIVAYLNGYNDIASRVQAGLGSYIRVEQQLADEIKCHTNACAQQPDVGWWLETIESFYEINEWYVVIPPGLQIKQAAMISGKTVSAEVEAEQAKQPDYVKRSGATEKAARSVRIKRLNTVVSGHDWHKFTLPEKGAYVEGFFNYYENVKLMSLFDPKVFSEMSSEFQVNIMRLCDTYSDHPEREWWVNTIDDLYRKDSRYIHIAPEYMIRLSVEIANDSISDDEVIESLEAYIRRLLRNEKVYLTLFNVVILNMSEFFDAFSSRLMFYILN